MLSETTTGQFQIYPNYFNSLEECQNAEKNKENTNPRYKNFRQTHFTAGDIEQFELYRDPTNGNYCMPKISLENNVFNSKKFLPENSPIFWEKYRDNNANSVMNTFLYIFEKYKKGIFVKIKDGKLGVFLPFSKKSFTNEWGDKIQVEPRFGNIENFIRYIQNLYGKKFDPKYINRFTDTWYANNCLVRYEFPVGEGDTGNTNMADMLQTLCNERKVPDIEFFLNRRDFPIIKRDATEAYEDMFDGQVPLLSHDYDTYSPILSMVERENYADIPTPTAEDWARVMRQEGRFFPKTCTKDFEMKSVKWKKRIPTALFRGGTTGCGVTVETNPRLKLAYLSLITPKDDDGIPLIDAGITSWNLRPRKISGEKYLKTIEIHELKSKYGIDLVPFMTPQKQAEYKYLINVDGHVSAFRLSLELSSGACILLVDSKYKMWYRRFLKPYKHFVPVKADLSDLIEQIKWCKNNDEKCKEISENAQEFAKKYLTKDGILDYLQKLLFELKKVVGFYVYNSISPYDIQFLEEKSMLKLSHTNPAVKKVYNNVPKKYTRNYGVLEGFSWVLGSLLKNGVYKKNVSKISVIHENKSTKILKVSIGNMGDIQLLEKSFEDASRERETIHDAFVSRYVTNKLLKKIPNFSYCYAYSEGKIYKEYIHGKTLSEYIKSDNFSIKTFTFILLQISLVLHVAQREFSFVHHDLTPWNIILLEEKKTVNYPINYTTVYRIDTPIIPVIIDNGRSHAIINGKHYSIIDMMKTSTIQDIITLLTTSLYEVTSRNLTQREVDVILYIANFLSGTEYRKMPFTPKGRDGLGELRYFLRKTKKYAELTRKNKYDLEKKTPLDFFEYIKSIGNFDVTLVNEFSSENINPKQIASMFAKKNYESTFLSFFENIGSCTIEESNKIFSYYTIQQLYENIENMHDFAENAVEKNTQKLEILQGYHLAKKNFNRKSSELLKVKPSEIKYPKIGKNIKESFSFSTDIFLFPEKILDFLQENPKIDDVYQYLPIIDSIFLCNNEYKLVKQDYNFYEKNFGNILNESFEQIIRKRNYIASINTVEYMVNIIYKKNVEDIKNRMTSENCDELEKMLKMYEKILGIHGEEKEEKDEKKEPRKWYNFKGYWTREVVKKRSNELFVFGDNDEETGNGGQAIIRGMKNAIGIPTKKSPTMSSKAFYTDDEYENNKEKIKESIRKILAKKSQYDTLVFSEDGLGTGLAQLDTKAPRTYQYLLKAVDKLKQKWISDL